MPQALEALGGRLDILVNNAGVTRDNLALRMKDEEWDMVIRVNLEAAFRLARAALKPMMMKQRFGRIISVTSVVGVTGNPGQANYAASKAGLIGMSKALAQEVAQPQRHGQLRRAGLHRLADDRCAARSAENRADSGGFRPGGWAMATISRPAWSIWRRARPAMSPGRRCT